MAALNVSSLVLGNLSVNCWFLANEDTKEALIFDPGAEAGKVKAYVDHKGWTLKAILLTHGHIDHIGAAEELRRSTGAKIYALDKEEDMLLDAKKNLSVFIERRVVSLSADEYLKDGQEINPTGISLKVFHTPGHTPGGCVYYCEEAGCLFAGDTLFYGSVGRTDFPGGSMSDLVWSVREKLFVLPDETRVCPGHGEETTIGHEKQYNPFV